MQSGFGSVTSVYARGVLTVALAQILAEQLSCELGKECGVLLACRQAIKLCGAAGKPWGGQCPTGKYEGERRKSPSRQRWRGQAGVQCGAEEGELLALLLRVSALGLSECRGGKGGLHGFREGNL